MAKIGDTVRFLNTTGGGVITKIEGQLAYVEENGFETPVLLKEIVVVLPAGHQPEGPSGARLMFDQTAFDKGRKDAGPAPKSAPAAEAPKPEASERVEETDHGNRLNISIAFEPDDVKRLSETQFSAVLVNDSNYFLYFTFSTRGADAREWTLRFDGRVAPNELIDLARITHADLPQYEQIALQCIAYKLDKGFGLKEPVKFRQRLNLKKFYKLHCFRPGIYFDTPVLEIPVITDDRASEPEPRAQLQKLVESFGGEVPDKDRAPRHSKKNRKPSPTQLLEPIEIDLHIAELTDTTAGMKPADMLAMQLDTVRSTMREHAKRIGQKIVFIHGKGDGVLREKVRDLLRREYPKADLQDASFREYGFGATLVTIH